MQLSDLQKVLLNVTTVLVWIVGVIIILMAAAKGRKMKDEMGVSFKTYLFLVGITEVVYTIGAIMILSAMGINVIGHLVKLEFWKFSQIVGKFDMSTVRIISTVGWFGFAINRTISFLSPAYLLFYGGKRLSKYFYYSAWTEIALESFMTALIAVSMIAG
jgi:hypothetical protein